VASSVSWGRERYVVVRGVLILWRVRAWGDEREVIWFFMVVVRCVSGVDSGQRRSRFAFFRSAVFQWWARVGQVNVRCVAVAGTLRPHLVQLMGVGGLVV
jgi:hypothetical protein